MTKLDIAKLVVSAVIGTGTSKIVVGVIKNNTNPEKITDVVTITSASFVLGSIAADASKKYTDAKIDEAIAWWNENVKPKLHK
jgi:hypothetical protein